MSARPNKDDHAELQYQSEHTSARKTPTVLPYLAILVAAAFLLLVMAYFMQQRTAESVEGLNQSVNAIHSFDQLVEDNRSLRQQVDQLQKELTVAQADNKTLATQLDDLENGPAAQEAKNREAVLLHFTMLEQALRDKSYALAADHVRALCSGDYDLNLGLANNEESFSPAQRLGEVIPILEKQKALEKGEVTVPQ